jgi:hypothetical protein
MSIKSTFLTLKASLFARKIEKSDDLRILLSALIGIIKESPNHTAEEYLDALEKLAKSRKMM